MNTATNKATETVNATFRPAATTALERASMPSTCECCGREELKRTVKMVSGDTVMWVGVGCAAKGTSVSVREINATERTAQGEADAARTIIVAAEHAAHMVRWHAHLDARCPEHRGAILLQTRALGGHAAARVGFSG